MANVLERLRLGSRAGVVRLRSLGDCVLTTPALHLLKSHRPDLAIAVVVEDRFAPVFEGNPDLDAILPPDRGALRDWRPDFCLNLHGGTRSLALTRLSGASVTAGFRHFRGACLYSVAIPRAQEILGADRKVHTAEHLASAMFHLGVPRCEIPRARLFADPPPQRPPYAVIHPVAAAPEKTWPAESFVTVARHLRQQGDLGVIFIGAAGDDLSPFREFETLQGASLAEVKSLLRGAALFAGNDSGPAHMAAAFGVPVAVIFGPSDSTVWAPWRTQAEVLASAGPIGSLEPARVVHAIDRLRVRA